MRRTIQAVMVAAALVATGQAFAEANCLPKAALPADVQFYGPALELGLVGGSVTLCTRKGLEGPRGASCWTVEPTTGALTASAVKMLPGRSQARTVDASGCVAGYCPKPRPEADATLLWATSTNGARVVVVSRGEAHVFDATSKAVLQTIPLMGGSGPDHTVIGNAPVRVLYLNDMIHIVGADAGPFAAVWSFKDSGARIGRMTKGGGIDGYSIDVYRGGTSILDGGHIAVADAALRRLVILDTANRRTTIVRQVNQAPCKAEDLENAIISDDTTGASAACRRVIAAQFAPYYDVELVRLPSGQFLAALSGKHIGEIAVLDKVTLREVRRLKLARCAR